MTCCTSLPSCQATLLLRILSHCLTLFVFPASAVGKLDRHNKRLMTGAQKTGAAALTTGAKPLPTGASPAAAAAAPEAPAAPAIPPEAQMPPPRNLEAFNRLCLASEGVIYQDEFLQIGLRSVYQTQFGRLMLYYGKSLIFVRF
jgi:hypothetical protein